MPDVQRKEYVEHLAKLGFSLEAEIGRGLSGTVVRAQQARLQRPVAVKFFDNTYSLRDNDLRKRFMREPLLLARAQHPGIPYVITAGVVPGIDIPYIVMEYVNGVRLREVLQRDSRLALAIAIQYTIDILQALGCAHDQGIVHRDVKPENIIVNSDRCTLIDFSIAFSKEQAPGLTRTTAAGQHLGTDDYMCPEQKQSMAEVDHRCDLYATGVVLFEMLTGTPRLLPERMEGDLVRFPRGVRAAIRRACAESGDERFASAAEFVNELRPFVLPGFLVASEARRALCTNWRCERADWTSRGFYRGPRILDPTADTFCDGCGAELKKHCATCGGAYRGSTFCGTCGSRWYELPSCKKCGSWLRQEDLETNTEDSCCSHGRTMPRWQEALAAASTTSTPLDDEEIPF